MKFSTVVVIMITAMGLSCSDTPAGEEGVVLEDVVEIEFGSNAHYYPQEGDVTKKISSGSVFQQEWETVHQSMIPIPELPEVNFNERMVILLMIEGKSTGGYTIDGPQIRLVDDQIVVKYAEVHPGNSCGTTQALTRPYKFISIPKSDKNIKFQKGKTIFFDCSKL
ncbi:protease complex subunit PrcB family protein [Gracilimonas halophila]|uniref:Protease complex subunit PrcB family protein n=1 Tax=Gracilimonas halophila TaxID=1834464 RepID=A0ABW5JI33_9BACT